MSDSKGKIVDAYAEWDDPHAFRVFLVREDQDGHPDLDNAKPMESKIETGDVCATVEGRLYRAAMIRCTKDFVGVRDKVLGWPKKAPAERVAKAVSRELDRIAKGEPCPTAAALQLVLMLLPRGGRR